MREEMYLSLRDTEWPLTYIDHDRPIARAIVTDGEGRFYFVRAEREDAFGRATLIETSGGGVEDGEAPEDAILRELREEIGAETEILCKIGVVSDYYNLVHRHNLNHYFLCRVRSFGDTHQTEDEIKAFHLSTLCLSYDEAVEEYLRRTDSKLGRLIARRELPVLKRAGEILRSGEGALPEILVTGFEPFGGDAMNPTERVLRDMPNALANCRVRRLLLPVEFIRAGDMACASVQALRPDAVLLFGQAGGRAFVTPETTARNRMDARIPDNAGYRPQNLPVEEGGAETLPSTLPVGKILEALQSAGIPAKASDSAGAYVCNAVFYRVQSCLAGAVPSGFIHVPYVAEQGHRELPSLGYGEVFRAVLTAVTAAAASLYVS